MTNRLYGNPCFDRRGNLYVARRDAVRGAPQKTRSRAYAWWNLPAGRPKNLEAVGTFPKGEVFSVTASNGSNAQTRLAISYLSKRNSARGDTAPIEVLTIQFDSAGHPTARQDCTLPSSEEAWLRLTPDGKSLAILAGTDSCALTLYKLTPQAAIPAWSLPGFSENPLDPEQMRSQTIDISRDGRLIAIRQRYASDTYGVEVRQIADHELLLSLREYCLSFSLSADGCQLAAWGTDLAVYDIPKVEDVSRWPPPDVRPQ